MMDCTKWENEITRREAGLLDAAAAKALDAHVAGCARCAAVDKKIRAGLSALAAMPVTPAPKDFLEDSWRRIQRATPAPASPLERLRRWLADRMPAGQPMWVPLAAAAAVIAVIAVLPSLRDGGPVRVASAPRYRIVEQSGEVRVTPASGGAATLATLAGGRLVVEHLDRARYTLGAGSKLEIGFGRPAAIELAAGTADVAVTPDPGKPYAVELSGARVDVLGTKFALVAGPSPMVRVAEGKVRVSGPDWKRELTAGASVAWGDEGPIDAASPRPAVAAAAVPPAPASPRPVAPASAAVAANPAVAPSVRAAASATPAVAAPGAASPSPTPQPAGATANPAEATGSQLNDPFQNNN